MKINVAILYTLLLFLVGTVTGLRAQNVYINLPSSNLFTRSEFTTVQNVMNTQGNTSWRLGGVDPQVRSTAGNFFKHVERNNTFLPTSILQWQLASIGGQTPPFQSGDVLPGYKWFTSFYQTWYQPTFNSRYSKGVVAFRFRLAAGEMESDTFHAGTYIIEVAQDYGSSGWYAIEFSPNSFMISLSVPEDIKWVSGPSTQYVALTSLNDFRSGSYAILSLGTMEVGHTVAFNLYAKTDKKEIKFKSLNGKDRKLDVSLIQLGGNPTQLITLPLTKNYQNYSTSGGFNVGVGNRAHFELQLSVLNPAFITEFFEAGTYTFKLDLEARSTNGSVSSQKEIEVTVVVPVLSEITIPNSSTGANFTFNTMEHYNQGHSQTIPNQIRVSNNENYELYVKSETNTFYSNGIQSDIPATVLEIGIEGTPQQVPLSTTPQKLINNGSPVLDKSLDLIYTISEAASKTLFVKEKKAYSINIVYGFTAL